MAELKTVKGLAELREAMLTLPKKLDRRVMNAALMAGAVKIRDEAKLRAPILKSAATDRRKPGTVMRAIRAQAGRPAQGMTATVIVRVRRLTKAQVGKFKKAQAKKGQKAAGAENPNDPFYWSFLEFGTSKAPAQPFMRPAFEAKKQAALDAIAPALSKKIDQEAEKLGRMRK